MVFQLIPTLDLLADLYRQPRSPERFKAYLRALQGDSKADMLLPIAGFNPMARPEVLDKLIALQQLEAEAVLRELLVGLNQQYALHGDRTIKVAINLADDLGGAWTNRYTTDYDSKFRINGLLNRHCCTPYFWTSEHYSQKQIKERSLSYIYRTIYRLNTPQPVVLEEHLQQELFVQKQIGGSLNKIEDLPKALQAFYQQQKYSEDYSCIFNFLYGDAASKALGYAAYGVERGACSIL